MKIFYTPVSKFCLFTLCSKVNSALVQFQVNFVGMICCLFQNMTDRSRKDRCFFGDYFLHLIQYPVFFKILAQSCQLQKSLWVLFVYLFITKLSIPGTGGNVMLIHKLLQNVIVKQFGVNCPLLKQLNRNVPPHIKLFREI